jgi:two-component system chemotaxis sensor kinase CheA
VTDTLNNESILDVFYYETSQYLESLERSILSCEKSSSYSQEIIHEVFRIMHNIKSSSAMMLLDNISTLAHTIEDLFFFLREQKPQQVDYFFLSDLILEGVDFIKVELEKVKSGDAADGDSASLIESIKKFLAVLKQNNSVTAAEKTQGTETSEANSFQVVIYFDEGCEMENIRAFAVIHNLKEVAWDIAYYPADIVENDNSVRVIREEGFRITFKTERTYNEILAYLNHTAFIKDLELVQNKDMINCEQTPKESKNCEQPCNVREAPQVQKQENYEHNDREIQSATGQSIISVNVSKLDNLLDLVGEMVIAEAMVTQNPDLKGLNLENFKKATRQLEKITSEVQDVVMSIRMVPLTTTFLKMNRVVRDMKKKLGKEVELELVGQETEVDKNIIEHISDPLMHLVRNAIDHGIETEEERKRKGKKDSAKVVIEAKNAGSDVLIIVRDNGKGLDKEKILRQAKANALLNKLESEMSDKEIYNLIFLPGFSTKDNVSEFSGRGVGMDVVTKNIETVGGSVLIESVPNEGSSVILKIPLTLAIINGMNIAVGKSCYTIPITTIKESFKPKKDDIIRDPDGNEMIMVRGMCYPILRLHELFKVNTSITNFTEGIIVMVENDGKTGCIFADRLMGEQQIVVKALPTYIGKIKGVAGCTLLGDGSISLILDIAGLLNNG